MDLILYELLSGRPVFPKDLMPIEIAFMVALKHELPDIPEFVLPSARELITECWAEEPGDRPFFDEIVNWLKEMKFKVMTKDWNHTIRPFRNKHCANLICLKSDGMAHYRKSIHNNTEWRVEERENETWKNHTAIVQNMRESARHHLIVLKGVSTCI